ncbi:MAG: hypothetical protein M1434_14165 [Chloroflexi bacterium]|nr:hypothetical protein [Chloroflexota bacterium]MCL5275866.1 hypothetical protein [Chloroflexota bacterium]
MPSREQTVKDAIGLFEDADNPSGLTKSSAWLGIYQTLLWYEPVNHLGYSELPHIIDADKLRPTAIRRETWTKPNVWQIRAGKVHTYLSEQLGCTSPNTAAKFDLLLKSPDYRGLQRQNTLGIAFAGLIEHVLSKYGDQGLSYATEVEASTIFPGITVPGRSGTPRMDVLASRADIPIAVISAKWSVRHDRLNDITNECPVYKAAYERIYRQGRKRLKYYVVTNEFDPSRLTKMLDDSCVDSIVHVHKSAVVDVCGLDGRLAELTDLTDFIDVTSSW